MQRRTKVTAIVFGTFLFLAITFLLTRALVGSGDERAKIKAILVNQARGDATAVLNAMPRCKKDPTCAQLTRERVAKLKRPGVVQILNFEPSTRAAFTDQTGLARVAWRTDVKTYPVVQCVFVRRGGPLTGSGVEIDSISNPIGLQSKCGG